jgi:hypothetical protein
MKRRAYIDIETTGLSRNYCEITVIGVGIEQDGEVVTTQLFGENLCEKKLLRLLEGVDEIYTYNGSRFDLPFIKKVLNVDLRGVARHRDLMYDCWKRKLKGGLKVVERRLRIGRQSAGIDGYMAVRLWMRYRSYDDKEALNTLLLYNKEDVVNLKVLRLRLNVA